LRCREVDGDASESGILKCMEKVLGDVMEYRKNYSKICEIPFNSVNKYHVSIHDCKDELDERYLLVMKVILMG